MTKLKANQAELIKNASLSVAGNQFIRFDTLQREVASVIGAGKECHFEVRRAREAIAHDREEALLQHRFVLGQHQ